MRGTSTKIVLVSVYERLSIALIGARVGKSPDRERVHKRICLSRVTPSLVATVLGQLILSTDQCNGRYDVDQIDLPVLELAVAIHQVDTTWGYRCLQVLTCI
jgi:hypothetical protein